MISCSRTVGRLAMATVGAGLLSVAATGVASAHVSIHADPATAGSSSVLTLSVPHGCEGSATTRIAVQIPAGINEVAPTVEPGWTAHKILVHLPEPVTLGDGDEITQRVDQVIYTAVKPLPDGYRARFELEVELPAEASGATLAFPTVQTCVKDEVAWTQVPADGQDPEELDSPAPSISVAPVTATVSGDSATDSVGDQAQASPVPGPATGSTWGIAGFLAGLAGLVAGSVALVRGRRPSA